MDILGDSLSLWAMEYRRFTFHSDYKNLSPKYEVSVQDQKEAVQDQKEAEEVMK